MSTKNGSSRDMPILTANHHLDGRTVTGDSYIIDTGAQMSFISLDKARSLGLDPNDPFSTLAIAGVGGTTDVPVFYVESLSLTTNEGVELFWSVTRLRVPSQTYHFRPCCGLTHWRLKIGARV